MITIHDYDTPSAKTWHLVTQGTRNSWESWQKSDSYYEQAPLTSGGRFGAGSVFWLGEADKALLQKLINAGADHSKFMRQLPIVIDISAPNYFWVEFDTYKINTTRNSTSKMHILGKYPFDASMFSWEDIDQTNQVIMLQTLNYLRDRWIDEGGKRKGPNAGAWRAMVQAIPDSWNYRSCWSGNYQVLRNMYHARKSHRLLEWREFCQFIETLPHADLITL